MWPLSATADSLMPVSLLILIRGVKDLDVKELAVRGARDVAHPLLFWNVFSLLHFSWLDGL